ncbi:meiosis-specific nuclear structural protein 1 [Drosophila guanche]|uniref:Meiosis-specific nuclear structural protein 1 n=1 Tax=Drosophila guanche TaxID=7266 RepID=A0A3B0KAX9_DROGU|nr:meiosis-specific nuclear structural protein 1 [Drosophila guanche]SPP82826.1 blast:Meiosis-specific nuclear structural protein 1 [Drosophila guanche]
MTTGTGDGAQQRTWGRNAFPAIFISGKPKFIVSSGVPQDLDFQSRVYSRNLMAELGTLQRSDELSKENPMHRENFEKAAISHELMEIKRAEFLEKKRRQQLRNDCEGLRTLEEQLRSAAIAKDLSDRMAQKCQARSLAVRARALGQERAAMELMELAQEDDKVLAQKEEQRKLRESLALQIEENRLRRQQEAAEKFSQRELSNARQKQIEEEDRAEQEERIRQKAVDRLNTLQFIQEKREFQEMEKARAREELRKLLETQADVEDRKNQLEEERVHLMRKHEEISTRIGQQLFQVENSKRIRDRQLMDLLEAEYKARADLRFRQEVQEKAVSRERTKQEMDLYHLEIQQRKLDELKVKRDELTARQEELASNNEEIEREEQLKAYRQRKAHGATLLSMIEDNHVRRAEATAEHLQYSMMKKKSEDERHALEESERLRMLSAVPKTVLPYLPKNALSKAEHEYFGLSQEQQQRRLGGGDC